MTQHETTQVQPIVETNRKDLIKNHPIRTALVAGALVIGGVAAVNYESGPDAANAANSESDADNNAPTIDGSLVEVSDEDLANGGYNCGHTEEFIADGESYSYDSQIDFLNANPETRESVREFQINDPTWGIGQNAFDFLMDNGMDNPNTSDDAMVEGDSQMNRYAHLVNRVELEADRSYANFTCDPLPVHQVNNVTIRSGNDQGERNHVNGITIPADMLDEFTALANKNADGQLTVDVVDLGMIEMTNGEEQHFVMVVTEAFGCNNPIRIFTPETPQTTPTTPGETTTTRPGVTTTTRPGDTTTTTVPEITTTTIDDKHPQAPVPGGEDDVEAPVPGPDYPTTSTTSTTVRPGPTTTTTMAGNGTTTTVPAGECGPACE